MIPNHGGVQELCRKEGGVPKKRKPVSKKARFEVFKRDGFQCQYCGMVPPSCVLEIDHIDPVSKGGGNEYENLVTSCFDCNRGKSDRPITSCPPSIASMTEALKEKELQLKEYRKMRGSINKRKSSQVNALKTIFSSYFTGHSLPSREQSTIRDNFVDIIDAGALEAAMVRACVKCPEDPGEAIKYFFGTCWRIIRGSTWSSR